MCFIGVCVCVCVCQCVNMDVVMASGLGFVAEKICCSPLPGGAQWNRSGVCGPYGPRAPADDPSGCSPSRSHDATCPLSHVLQRSSRANYFIIVKRACESEAR